MPKKTFETAAEAQAHLIVQLKDNQPTLCRKVEAVCNDTKPLSGVQTVDSKKLRKRIKSHPAERTLAMLTLECPTLRLEHVIQDDIPDVRRSRRTGAATKRELILVLTNGAGAPG